MNAKTILVAVADPQALGDITQALGDGWEVTSVSSETDAFEQLEQRSFTALLVDFNFGSPDASQLLNQALEKRPETVRFLLAYEADLALVAAYVSGPHEILPKPIEPASLKSRIEQGVAPEDSNASQGGGESATSTGAPPAVPAVYSEVLNALESPGVTRSQVGEIIAQDEVLTAEVLKLTKSAYLGLPANLTDPVDAVEAVGLPTVKALVMALRFLAEHSDLKPGYLSVEKLWQHSLNVALLARDLTLFETKDRTLAAEALVAGFVHDLGKVVLASNFDDLYGRVHSLARKQPVALWDVEKEMFGASHGEIGGCLVGMWNLPSSVVQATAFHHEPPLGESQQLTPLAAVHIANVLEQEFRPSDEFRVTPVINPAFLNEIGLLQRLPVWRAVFAGRPAAGASPEVESAETSQPQLVAPGLSNTSPLLTANQLLAPAGMTRTATSGQPGSETTSPASVTRQRRWFYAGAAAAVLGCLALWLGTQPDEPVRALTPESTLSEARVAVSPAPAPEPAAATVPEAVKAMAVSEEATTVNTVSVPDTEPASPEATGAVATASQVTATNALRPTLATEENARPNFRLNGIFYTAARPSAIVNSQSVYVGDSVSGATVVGIDRTRVTLQTDDGRRICVYLEGAD